MKKISNKKLGATITFYQNGGENACSVCGIISFDHRHREGTLPNEFERIEKMEKGSMIIDDIDQELPRSKKHHEYYFTPFRKDQPEEKAEKKCTWCGGVEWHSEPTLNPETPLYCMRCGYNEGCPQPESEGENVSKFQSIISEKDLKFGAKIIHKNNRNQFEEFDISYVLGLWDGNSQNTRNIRLSTGNGFAASKQSKKLVRVSQMNHKFLNSLDLDDVIKNYFIIS